MPETKYYMKRETTLLIQTDDGLKTKIQFNKTDTEWDGTNKNGRRVEKSYAIPCSVCVGRREMKWYANESKKSSYHHNKEISLSSSCIAARRNRGLCRMRA